MARIQRNKNWLEMDGHKGFGENFKTIGFCKACNRSVLYNALLDVIVHPREWTECGDFDIDWSDSVDRIVLMKAMQCYNNMRRESNFHRNR